MRAPNRARPALATLIGTAAVWTLAQAAPAAADGTTIVPGQGDSVVANIAPGGTRPRSLRVWETVELASTTAKANSNVIYLNRCAGAGCEIVQGTTNSTSDPVRSSLGHGVLSPFSRSDDVWNRVVACMKDVYAPFNVEITETDPGAQPHFEIIIGGTPQQIGLSSGVGGVSPFSCAPYIPNSVVFVFDVWGDNAEEICATAAQELAHSFSLDHAIEPSDPMTYFPYVGRRHYKNAQVQCGSDCDSNGRSPLGIVCTGPQKQEHECACGNGAQTQNSYQLISALFGDGNDSPPLVKIMSPKVGQAVGPGFLVSAEITDDVAVASAELRVDDVLITSTTEGPYDLAGPFELAEGTHTIVVTGYDTSGAPGRARIQVVVGPGCKSTADCPNDTDSCIGGRCVAGPEALGGLGQSCGAATDCSSWQCANDNGAKYCVESCEPGQCPSGFGCRDDGLGGGVCWPGHDEGFAGFAGCAAGSDRPPLGSIALGLGFAFAIVRRRRRVTPR
jgi:hypothetical protein